MKFLYRKYPAKKKEVIEVQLEHPAPVKFMTAVEFKKYSSARTHTYYRGEQMDGGVRFALPFDGVWHVVVEKGEDRLRAASKLRLPDPEKDGRLNAAAITGSVDDMEVRALSLGGRSEG